MEGALLGLLQSTFGRIVCKLCHSRLMVLSLVNVFLKHSTSFPSPHSTMIFVDKLYQSLFSMKIYQPTFIPFPVIIIIIIWDRWMVDISSNPSLGDFVERNSFPISTILFVNWTLLVKSTLNQPSFGGGSFVHSCPSPHSTNVWGHFVWKFYPNLFFLDRFDCDFSARVLLLGLIHCWTFAPFPFLLWDGFHRAS